MPVIRIDAEKVKEGRNKESPGRNRSNSFTLFRIAGSNGAAPKLGIQGSTPTCASHYAQSLVQTERSFYGNAIAWERAK